MRSPRSGERIGVVADVRLRQEVADRVVGEGLREGLVDLGLGEPVQGVVGERLREALIGVGALRLRTQSINGGDYVPISVSSDCLPRRPITSIALLLVATKFFHSRVLSADA
jgi:hypothetical protein